MAPIDGVIDVAGNLVKIAIPAAPTVFTTISELTGYQHTRSKGTTTTKVRVMGNATPHTKTADDETVTMTLSGLLNLGDTDGQNYLQAAYYANTDVILQKLPDGVNGDQYTGKITEYSDNGDQAGDFTRVSYTFVSTSARTAVVGA
jgi:hypothetical protein